jgi:hypothetical protein
LSLLLAACPGSLSFDYVPPSGGTGGAPDSDAAAGSGGLGGGGGVDIGTDGSAGGLGGAGGTVATTCANADTLLRTKCTTCHSSPAPIIYANLDLMSAGVAQRLVGQPATTISSGACGGKGNLLDPGVLPATGILIDKINFSQTCGSGMPVGGVVMAPADIDCLQAWANGLVAGVGTN